MGAREDTEAAEAAVVRRVHRSVPLDGRLVRLTRSQAGAVGHVVRVRGVDGVDYALKIYSAELGHRADVEQAALRRMAAIGLPVPVVLLSGRLDHPPAAFVLMTWLAGRRWAECRPEMGAAQALELITQAGHLLRQLHSAAGSWFGDLLQETSGRPTALDLATARLDRLLPEYRRAGGPEQVAHRVSRFVRERSAALVECRSPVLCHNDFNSGNIMVQMSGAPRICGVFDLERASWADPMDDLSLTFIHVRTIHPELVDVLLRSYGLGDDSDLPRLQAYEALRLLAERCWISSDRPQGWQESIAALDGRLHMLLGG